jgi:hypothetical protein
MDTSTTARFLARFALVHTLIAIAAPTAQAEARTPRFPGIEPDVNPRGFPRVRRQRS